MAPDDANVVEQLRSISVANGNDLISLANAKINEKDLISFANGNESGKDSIPFLHINISGENDPNR